MYQELNDNEYSQIFATRKRIAGLSKKLTSETANYKTDDFKQNDLYIKMKPLLTAGLIIRLIPFKPTTCTYFSLSQLPFYITSFVVWAATFVQALIGLWYVIVVNHKRGTDHDLGLMAYVASSDLAFNFFLAVLIHTHFLRKSTYLFQIFKKWAELSARIHLKEDKYLGYFAYFLVGVFICQLSTKVCTFAYVMNRKAQNATSGTKVLTEFALEYFPEYKFLLNQPFNVIMITVFYYWSDSLQVLAPHFVVFFARVVSFQFRSVVESATNTSLNEIQFANMRNEGSEFWTDLVSVYRELLDFLKTINNFTSPIVFSWLAWSIFNFCTKMFSSLSGKELWGTPSALFAMEFAVDLVVFLFIIISAAYVNRNAVKMLDVLRLCPKERYFSTEVCRLERQIATGPNIGLTGMSCFVISKPFIIKVFNVILALEMVMLQSVQT